MGYVVDDYAGSERTTGKLAVNGTVKGQLQRPHDEDWFAVSLEAGVTYYLKLTSFSPVDIDQLAVAFFDPREDRIVAGTNGDWDKNFALEFKPATSGVYYALAANIADNLVVSDYSLSLAPRSTPDDFSSDAHTQGVLTVGASSRGVFEQKGDVDWFKFHAEKGYCYQLDRESLGAQFPVKGFASSMHVVDAQGRIVTTPSFGGFNPVESGDYYVAVAGATEGAYGITVKQWRDDFPQFPGTDGRLVNGSTVSGSIDYEHDADWLRIEVEKGKYYTFKLRNEQNFGFWLSLYDEAGESLPNFSLTAKDGTQWTWQATGTGTVYLALEREMTTRIIDYATPYSVSLAVSEDDIGQDAAQAGNLSIGATVHGTMQNGADRDAFKATLEAGVTYRFGLTAEDGGEYLKLDVASANDSTALASKRVGNGGAIEFTPSSPGEYLVTVGSDGGVKLNLAYTLAAERASDDWAANMAGAGQLIVGTDAGGKLENTADRDWHAVRFEAGNTYWIEAKYSSDADTALRVLDAAGNPLKGYTENSLFPGPLSFTPGMSGTYYVEVTPRFDRTGNYMVTAELGTRDDGGDSMATATALPAGTVFNGNLEVGSDSDVFRLDVVTGQTYVLNWNTSVFPGINVKLTTAEGKALPGITPGTAYLGDRAAFLAESTGPVYVTVKGSKAGTYQIGSEVLQDDHPDLRSSAAKSLEEGGSISGNLEYGYDRDVFGMQLDANRPYVLKIASTTPGHPPPAVEFLAYGGYVSTSDQTVVNGERTVKFVAQSAGQHFLELRSSDFKSTPYTITALPFSGDGKGPVLVAQSIADHAVGVPMTERSVSLTFSEPIVIDSAAIVLRDSAGNAVSTDIRSGHYPLVKGDTLTFKTGTYLGPDTYTLSLPASAIHDAAGNRYAGPETLTFSTALPADKPGPGNDVYVMKPGAEIDGGAGVDTLSVGSFVMFDFVSPDENGFIVRNLLAGTAARIQNIERLQFLDQVYALDVDGIAGQAYRLYQAAFNRAPDQSGLGFWIGKMDGGTSLNDVANEFIKSAEFSIRYGASPQDTAFVQTLYQNVLHRSPDTAGFDFWAHALQSGASRSEVLIQFSESPENKAALAEIIGSGFTYQNIWPE